MFTALNDILARVESVCDVGIILDRELSFEQRVNMVVLKVHYPKSLRCLKQYRNRQDAIFEFG